MEIEFGLGWERDDEAGDHRDWRMPGLSSPASLSPTRNRDIFFPTARAQGVSNLCVDFATCRAMEFLEAKAGRPFVPFSPLFSAWNDRAPERRAYNTGTQIRKAADAVRQIGVCAEDAHPFELSQRRDYLARMGQEPPWQTFAEAKRHQVTAAYRIADGDWNGMLSALEAGYGFVFGVPVYGSFFNTPSTGIPPAYAGGLSGYHAMFALDLDIVGGVPYALVLNSWGTGFGKSGWCYMSEAHMRDAEDVWCLTQEEILP